MASLPLTGGQAPAEDASYDEMYNVSPREKVGASDKAAEAKRMKNKRNAGED